MRKFLMITTAVYGLSLFAPVITQAQTCKQAPDCVDMGYDKSVDKCAGKKMLKCPFNTNFVSCEDGESGDALNLFDLAWEEAMSISLKREDLFDDKGNFYATFSYTLPADGCVIGKKASYGGSPYGTVFINGQKADIPTSSSSLICFKEGTQIALDDNTQWPNPVFIPAESSGAIKLTFEVENGGSIDLSPPTDPIVATYGSVDWGDGSIDDITNNTSHTYESAGEYTVTIRGDITSLRIDPTKAYISKFVQLNLKSLKEVLDINDSSFAGDCSKATGSIPELPPNLIIGRRMFYKCSGLTGNIPSLPSTLTDGHYMFQECSGLTGNIPTLPSRLTDGNRMFIDCSSLTGDIPTLPSTLTDGNHMFSDCTSLNGTINNSNLKNTQINDAQGMFKNCSGLTGNIPALPSGITNGNYMFYKCSGLTGEIINIPNNLTEGNYMFQGCTGLRGSIPTLPSTLTEAGYMFHSCTGLSGNVPPLPPALIKGTRMFYGCSGLSGSITELPSTLTTGGYMFSGCSGLSGPSPQKPEGLTTFGNIFEGTHIENDGSWPDSAWESTIKPLI